MVSGKEFRISLRCPKPQKIRVVPAFSLQSLQRNTIVKWQGERSRPPVLKPSLFKYYYDREEFPIGMEVGKGNSFEKKIEWKVPPEKLDYHHYLPMFFDGLSEISYPCSFFALQGIYDFLDAAPHKVFPVVPQLIMPLKNALNTRNRQIIISTLKVIQHLVLSAEMVGEALVPYYRQLLPIFNIYKNDNVSTFDEVDFTAEKGENIGDLVGQTLELLERHGGEDAFINIKYMVPTYESCINN